MRPMLPKIRKTLLPKRKASSNAVPRGLRSPRTCFFAPVSPHRSHAVVLHGYPRLSRCFLTCRAVSRSVRAVFSHCRADFPLRHAHLFLCAVTHTCSYVPSRTVFSHCPRLFSRCSACYPAPFRAGFLAPPRIDSSYRPRTFPRTVPTRPFCAHFWPPHLWPLLPRRAILHRYSRAPRTFYSSYAPVPQIMLYKNGSPPLIPPDMFSGSVRCFRFSLRKIPISRLTPGTMSRKTA